MRHVLIVDDNSDIRLFLRCILESEGFDCLEAVDGEEALQLVGYINFDLILLDNQMPKMNGLQVLQSMQNKIGNTNPKVIMLTGNPNDTIRDKAFQAGAKAFLSKPFGTDELLTMIHQVLAESIGTSGICSYSRKVEKPSKGAFLYPRKAGSPSPCSHDS